jgi:hypothetical protein
MSNVSLTRAEFSVNSKVNFWDGTHFKEAAVLGVVLNPVDNIIEYRLFYREKAKSAGGRRGRTSLTTTPYFIKESVHFKKPKKTGLKGTVL